MVRVRVDETGRHDETGGVDGFTCVVVDDTHRDDAPVDDADVLARARRTGAVDDGASDDLAIEHQAFSISFAA